MCRWETPDMQRGGNFDKHFAREFPGPLDVLLDVHKFALNAKHSGIAKGFSFRPGCTLAGPLGLSFHKFEDALAQCDKMQAGGVVWNPQLKRFKVRRYGRSIVSPREQEHSWVRVTKKTMFV